MHACGLVTLSAERKRALVDLCVKNRPVDYLRFGFSLGLKGRSLTAGAREWRRVLGRSEKIPVPERRLRTAELSHFAVELVRVIGGFTGRR